MREFKVGDKVNAVDGAWSRILGRDIRARVQKRRHCGQLIEYRVVGHGEFPIGHIHANTLIVDPETESFIALNDCNLSPSILDISVQFIVDGRNVTTKLSAESKKAVLEAHLEG